MTRFPGATRWQRAYFLWALTIFCLGCGKQPAAAPVADQQPKILKRAPNASQNLTPEKAKGVFLAEVPAGSFGPHLQRSSAGWVLAWHTPDEPGAGWYSVFYDGANPSSEPLRFSDAIAGLRRVSFQQVDKSTLGLLTARRGGRGNLIELYRLGGEGELKNAPQLVVDTPGEVLWLDILPTMQGGLAVWAEQSQGSAQIFAAAFDHQRVVDPLRVAEHVRSWQFSAWQGSIVVATLEGLSSPRVTLRLLDSSGKPRSAPSHATAHSVTGGLDLDLVMTSERIVVAWSQMLGKNQRIFSTEYDLTGKQSRPPEPLTLPRGQQALVHLVADQKTNQIVVVWDETDDGNDSAQTLFLSDFDGDRPLKARAQLASLRTDPLLPQFALRSGELAVITESPLCEGDNSCPDTFILRTAFVTRGSRTRSRAEDLRSLSPPDGPSMLWDLSCPSQGSCMALAADAAMPTAVYGIELDQQGDLPGPLQARNGEVRIQSREVIADVPELAALVGAVDDGSELLSWLSYFDPNIPYQTPQKPAPDGRRAPVRAVLKTVHVGEPGFLQPSPATEQVISYRARSLGGVSLVPPAPRGLLAWTALDGRVPQAFVTLIEKSGKRLKQKMLTRSPGEVSDVTATRVSGGYVVAWVDSRESTAEVWAQFVDESLGGQPAVMVSSGAHLPTGLVLMPQDGAVLLLWSDSRGAGRVGGADLYSTHLDPKTAQPLKKEEALVATPGHSHSPSLAKLDMNRLLLAWIESDVTAENETTQDLSTQGSGTLMWATWDGTDGHRLVGTPSDDLASASKFSVYCQDGRCDAFVASHLADGAALSLCTYDGSAPPQNFPLLSLGTNTPSATAPLLLGNRAYFVDQAANNEWQLVRIVLEGNRER